MIVDIEKMRRVVVVHGGAGGVLPEGKRHLYRELLKTALQVCNGDIGTDFSADVHLERFTNISQVLEDSVLTNTGYGSCVCNDGSVHCDSCVLHVNSSKGDDVNIGCVVCNSSRYPMKDAISVITGQTITGITKDQSFPGVVKPIIKVGNVQSDRTLISPEMEKTYNDLLHTVGDIDIDNDRVQDTIGVLLYEKIDDRIMVTIGSSSGGNMLREWARIGSAGVVGSGCWIEKVNGGAEELVCIMVSGQGEAIIKTDLARSIAKEIARKMEKDRETMISVQCVCEFLKTSQAVAEWQVGVVGVVIGGFSDELFYVHNTPTFVLGSNGGDTWDTHLGKTSRRRRWQSGQWPL